MNRNGQPVRCLDGSSDSNDPRVESRNGEAGELDQLVRGLEHVEDGGQSEVEDAVEGKDVESHGKYDTKNGVLANTNLAGCRLLCFYDPITRR